VGALARFADSLYISTVTESVIFEMMFSPTAAVGAAGLLVAYLLKMAWLERKAFKAMKATEAKLILPDSEDTRLLIAKAKRAKAEFDWIEHQHDLLAKQRLGKY
jgi:hypothetical protein